MLLELPRLTNSLRLPFDADQAYLNRKSLLQSLNRRSYAASFAESELARKIIYRWEEASVEVRQLYKQFIAAVVELIGGEVMSEEFQEVALNVYRLFSGSSGPEEDEGDKRILAKKFELQKLVGHTVLEANILKVASLVERLSGLQNIENGTGYSPELVSEGTEDLEFGADLVFQPPARFLVDISPEDAEILMKETSTSSSNHEEWPDYGRSADFHPSAGEGNFDLEWLRDACDKIVRASTSQLPRDELAMTICRILDSEKPGDEIAGDLLDLVGDSSFETVQDLIVVTVQTESERQIDKLRRKEEKKHRRGTDHGIENELSSLSFSSLLQASEKKNLLDDLVGHGDGTQFAVTALPQGTVRKHFKGYEEVTIPPTPTAPMKPGEKLIEIKELDDIAQAAFHGYKSLNRIQSRIFQTTYYTNENILVCAPTGAGKTNIAMISILHEIGQHFRDGYLHKDEFKIVYVAPMKALAAEVTSTFSHRLSPLNVTVRELTGDMQLSKNELEETQMIVTTPEKWDVITRKSSDMSLSMLVKLLIIDEVHLLNDDRGPVIEALVARTLRQARVRRASGSGRSPWHLWSPKAGYVPEARAWASLLEAFGRSAQNVFFFMLPAEQPLPPLNFGVAEAARPCGAVPPPPEVESTQSMIRIVGLSATLPNYLEVSQFLRVNPEAGLFFFDSSYRPVPLEQQYIGISEHNFLARNKLMNEICYNKVVDSLRRGHQVMVFVHSRKDTGKTADKLFFSSEVQPSSSNGMNVLSWNFHFRRNLTDSEIIDLTTLLGMLEGVSLMEGEEDRRRQDLETQEHIFLHCSFVRQLWSKVIIELGLVWVTPQSGADLFMTDLGGFLGSKGRTFWRVIVPVVCWSKSVVASFEAFPLCVGIIKKSNVEKEVLKSRNRELVQHFEYAVGVHHAGMLRADRGLTERLFSEGLLRVLVCTATLAWGVNLPAHTVVIKGTQIYDAKAGGWRDLGMLDVMQIFGRAGRPQFDKSGEGIIITTHEKLAYYLRLLTSQLPIESQFINSLKDNLNAEVALGTVTNVKEACAWLGYTYLFIRMKMNPLAYGIGWDEVMADPSLSLKQRALVSDAARALDKAKMMRFDEKSGNFYCTELGRIASHFYIQYSSVETYNELLRRHMNDSEVIDMVAHSTEFENIVLRDEEQHELETLARTCPLEIKGGPSNKHGKVSILIQILRKLEERGVDLDRLYEMQEKEIGALIRYAPGGKVDLTIAPEFVWKDRFHGTAQRWWILVEDSENDHIYHSELFTLTKKMAKGEPQKLSFTVPIFEPHPPQYFIRAISDSWLHAESFYTISFQNLALPEAHTTHTELLDLKPLPVTALGNATYEALYKFTHFNPIQTQAFHVLYHTDQNVLLGAPTGSGKTISAELAMLHLFNTQPDMKVELTGEYTPDLTALLAADIIISTPEKWDGISRNWHSRGYVKKVGLMILDEIHLLGADRGPILEMFSKLTSCTSIKIGINDQVEHSLTKFTEKLSYNPKRYVLGSGSVELTWRLYLEFPQVIVSRMRYISSQTERSVRFVGLSTALANAHDLADWLGVEENGLFNFKPSVRPVPLEGYPGKYYCPRMNSMNKPTYAAICTHSPTKPVLIFVSSRRQTRLTALDLIQVLVCTSTLAWGVNLPAHLVIIKGTEYFDAKAKRYVDFPITDILQMMGRAGRPQFDQHGKAIILVHEPKKSFYKKFLYEPFPVESSLREQLHDHINAEIVSGTICHKEDAIHYLTWTYLFRRLVVNPAYYGLEATDPGTLSSYLSSLVLSTFEDLEDSGCIKIDEDRVEPMMLGSIASQYYLKYTTLSMFASNIEADTSLEVFLHILSGASEYDELPVRHNEENHNAELSSKVRYMVDKNLLDDPHVKANLLFQAHFSRVELPITDYVTDLKSVLDQSIRIIQAMIDLCANSGWLSSTLTCMHLLQMVMQGLWFDNDSPLWMLPCMTDDLVTTLGQRGILNILQLLDLPLATLQGLANTSTTKRLHEHRHSGALANYPYFKVMFMSESYQSSCKVIKLSPSDDAGQCICKLFRSST
ncbi:hypothetical protein DH2020_013086 [Rehmannia glutinosa]|uniref:Activating signal cointegrator 1 complex subunit 3 n=1 Tax=Rehmannia glutinosa TaxID=99300 RepID=A0ABR0X4D0_REHGL